MHIGVTEPNGSLSQWRFRLLATLASQLQLKTKEANFRYDIQSKWPNDETRQPRLDFFMQYHQQKQEKMFQKMNMKRVGHFYSSFVQTTEQKAQTDKINKK